MSAAGPPNTPVTCHASRRFFRARNCCVLLAWLVVSCELMVGSDVDRVECEQEGMVGPPACRTGESCQQGVCRPCLTQERCGDGLDNDCDGAIDDGCDPDGGSGGAAAAGSTSSLAGTAGSLAGTAGRSPGQGGAGEAGSSGFGFGAAGQSGIAGASGARNRSQRP